MCDTIKAILCDIILITYIAKANFVRLIHRISFLNSFFGVERRSFPPPEQAAGSLSKQNFGSRFIIRHNAQKCPCCFTLTIKNIKRRSFALQSLCALLTRIKSGHSAKSGATRFILFISLKQWRRGTQCCSRTSCLQVTTAHKGPWS